MGFTKRELIEFLDGLVELASMGVCCDKAQQVNSTYAEVKSTV